jgi:iron complex outermembrane receptor protein
MIAYYKGGGEMLGSFSQRLNSGRAGVPALCLVLGFSIWHPAVAQTPVPSAPAAALEEIQVTGSRIITDGTQSPTPLTVVSADQLLSTTPSNLADALNKLPQFNGSSSQSTIQNATGNATGNFLNLRNLGAQRTLVLFDGDRMPPTAANGTVDTNTIPQMLIQRVDIVTGGASAVYGSDAVAGVVNFILDKHFNGIEAVVQGGDSGHNDDESYRVGLAAGSDLFDKRGHFEFSLEQYNSNGIPNNQSRPYGAGMALATGAGTAANPFALTPNGRQTNITFGGVILGGPPSLVGMTFNPITGALQPFTHGTATGTAGAESGGDGGFSDRSGLVASLRTRQAFGRFDYDLTDNIKAHVQVSLSQAQTFMPYYDFFTFGSQVLSDNAYLPAAAQAAMAAAGADSITVARFFNSVPGLQIATDTTNWYAATGLDGKFLTDYAWHFNYAHSRSQQTVANQNNPNSALFAAATDAVIDPATGGIVCHVALTQYASLYPGCQPLNITGGTVNPLAADYVRQQTQFSLVNTMDDVSGSIDAKPFSDWAGPVAFALSGEYRKLTLVNNSNAQAGALADCTGLRVNCDQGSTSQYVSNVVSDMYAAETISEAAFETEVPLLKDLPLVKDLDFNGAIRETHYSTSGNAMTWKLGLTWNLIDDFQIRATRSQDIRAPTLVDLYSPAQAGLVGFNDLHTGVIGDIIDYAKGNPALTPEVAKTTTAGFVYRPSWLPRFNVSVDYYDIKITNVITQVDGDADDIQALCEASNGTSPYCSLYNRPLPFSNRTPANFPISVSTESLNVANTITHGVDAEINYNFDLSSIAANTPGNVAMRLLTSYQPELSTQTIAGSPYTVSAGVAGLNILSTGISKIRANAEVGYTLGAFNAIVDERWMSSVAVYPPPIVTTIRGVPAYSYTDLTLRYTVDVGRGNLQPFISVQNIFDKQPPIIGNNPSVPGLFPPVPNGYDLVGRYFTAGFRLRF